MAEWNGVAGKRVLITGATGGIGLAAAKELVRRGARLTLVARNPDRARQACAEIAAAYASGSKRSGAEDSDATGSRSAVDVLEADLSCLVSVKALANEALERYARIDVLVNNAGAVFSTRELTAEGLERTWALNHLAPFLLTSLLLDRLRQSAPARVITTASGAHKGGTIPFENLDAQRSYRLGGFVRYGETKLANILFTAELARRAQGTGVSAYCFHPGLVASGFNRNNGSVRALAMLAIKPFCRSVERGARTLVWLADTPDPGPDGAYFLDERPKAPSAVARDPQTAKRLWEVSEEQVNRALLGHVPG